MTYYNKTLYTTYCRVWERHGVNDGTQNIVLPIDRSSDLGGNAYNASEL